MKNLFILLLTFTTTHLTAQNTTTWIGGTPGKTTNWNEPRNWTGHHVPDEFSLVIIAQTNSGHHAQPHINGAVTVAGIEIHSGANLTISETGELTVDGEYTYSEGVVNYGGKLINNGKVILKNIDGNMDWNDGKGFASKD